MNIYQHNKFLQSVISTLNKAKYIQVVEILLALIWVDGRGYNIQITNFCRITTCNEGSINRVHLTFSLFTNYQNRPCGKGINTTAFVFWLWLWLCKHFTV